jgi:circadian clock protein KaiC
MKKRLTLVKVPSGISGFDEISLGGIPKGRTTLVSGTSGAGKTVFAAQFLYKGIVDYKENGVFVTFEESPIDIERNMGSFGWDIKKLIKQKKWAFVDASPDEAENIEVGKYDLEAFLARISHATKKVKAKRVAIDSISALFPRYEDAATIRRELFKVAAKLKSMGITAIMTAERPDEHGSIARFGIEEFVSDNVILLHNRLTTRGNRERSIDILKFRGSPHETSEAPLIVTDHGMELFPRPKPELTGQGFVEKIKTGIIGLDDALYGGVYRNSTTLINGASGTGKTVSTMQFILEGAKNGEKCLFIEFEESPEQLFRNAESFGWNLRKYVNNGMIQLICHYPEDLKAEQYMKVIKDLVLKHKPQRVAFDSLSAIQRIYEADKFREFVVGLNAFLKMQNCTNYLTNTTAELLGMTKITETHLSTATDNIILLKYVEIEGEMRRIVNVLKARGSDHDKGLREFMMTKKGVVVGETLKEVRGILSTSSQVLTSPTHIMKKIYDLREKLEGKEISQPEFERRKKELEAILSKTKSAV